MFKHTLLTSYKVQVLHLEPGTHLVNPQSQNSTALLALPNVRVPTAPASPNSKVYLTRTRVNYTKSPANRGGALRLYFPTQGPSWTCRPALPLRKVQQDFPPGESTDNLFSSSRTG